jgi:hypothetical protein
MRGLTAKEIFIVLVIIALLSGYFFIKHKNKSTEPMVPFGTIPEKNEGIQPLELEGVFDAANYIVPGRPTIISFGAEYCTGTRELNNSHFPRFLRIRPDVAVFYARLPSDWNKVYIWEQHRIKIDYIPHIIIYGPDGKLIAEDKEGYKKGHTFLFKWLNYEIDKQREKEEAARKH